MNGAPDILTLILITFLRSTVGLTCMVSGNFLRNTHHIASQLAFLPPALGATAPAQYLSLWAQLLLNRSKLGIRQQ